MLKVCCLLLGPVDVVGHRSKRFGGEAWCFKATVAVVTMGNCVIFNIQLHGISLGNSARSNCH
jgi:hypothetical protein